MDRPIRSGTRELQPSHYNPVVVESDRKGESLAQKPLQPFSNALALAGEGDDERRVRFDDHDSPRLETSFAIVARPSIKERLHNNGHRIGIELEDTVAASART